MLKYDSDSEIIIAKRRRKIKDKRICETYRELHEIYIECANHEATWSKEQQFIGTLINGTSCRICHTSALNNYLPFMYTDESRESYYLCLQCDAKLWPYMIAKHKLNIMEELGNYLCRDIVQECQKYL